MTASETGVARSRGVGTSSGDRLGRDGSRGHRGSPSRGSPSALNLGRNGARSEFMPLSSKSGLKVFIKGCRSGHGEISVSRVKKEAADLKEASSSTSFSSSIQSLSTWDISALGQCTSVIDRMPNDGQTSDFQLLENS